MYAPVQCGSVCAVCWSPQRRVRRLAAAVFAAGWSVPGSAPEPPALCSEPDGAPHTHCGTAQLGPAQTQT